VSPPLTEVEVCKDLVVVKEPFLVEVNTLEANRLVIPNNDIFFIVFSVKSSRSNQNTNFETCTRLRRLILQFFTFTQVAVFYAMVDFRVVGTNSLKDNLVYCQVKQSYVRVFSGKDNLISKKYQYIHHQHSS
jgi:hypothetical protein